MNSHTTERFRKTFDELPKNVREQATNAYKLFQENPYHSSLRFKQIHPTRPIFSVRVGLGYRALGLRENVSIIWFWIGSHSDYDKLLDQLK